MTSALDVETSGGANDLGAKGKGPAATGGKGAAPAKVVLLLLLTAILFPVAYVVYGAFLTTSPGDPAGALTLLNWRIAFSTPDYLRALAGTILLGLAVAPVSVALGGALAWIVARTDAPGARRLAVVLLLPMMISNLVTTLAWIALAAPNAGFINAYARAWFGLPTLFNIYSFQGIVLVDVLHYSAFAFLAIVAALASVDASLEEASFLLGAGPIETGMRVSLPLIAPTLATSFLVVFVFTVENFSAPTLLGTPIGFQTLPSIIYLNMSVSPARPNLAAASGVVLLLIVAAGSVWQSRIAARAGRYVTIGRKGSRSRRIGLGRWRYAATGGLLAFIALAVVLPYAVLALCSFLSFLTPRLKPSLFTFDNYRALFSEENLTPTFNSLAYSVFGGLGASVLYFGASLALRPLSGSWRRLADLTTIIPTAMPALVLGVGLVWAFVGLPLPIYGTAAILIIAYIIRFCGFGLRHASDALSRIAPDLAEAARLSGASPQRAALDVIAPLAVPAFLSLWTALFISIFMEISATIILYSPSSRTLPTVLWNDMASGSQTRAFAVACAQAFLIFAILALTDRKFGVLRDPAGR